ncbi:hypothetical protein [Brevibacillus choshinensis]|uniref:Uncharacterized protein n=1 Tax=Brevibacillus choshinensis TaxID=54911 RepID=A0ABX7FQK8_BRECH|nr:hypothetical protein [Brevibacillus choshinensis]QRG68085.1 hypothetical protein JNE38_02430 [Brevibacillus choshinensis]
MRTESTSQSKSRPVVVWESRPERQAGNVISLPSRAGHPGVIQEESVKTWTVGPEENPAVITEVSSGFHRRSAPAATPQATRMSMAA